MNILNKPDVSVEEMEVKISEFLLKNPNPKDLEFHAFAAGLGVEKETLEEVAYRMLATVLGCASSWGLLHQDPNLMHNAMYISGCDPEVVVTNIISNHPNFSPNVVELALRLRKTDALQSIFNERGRVLSYAEEQMLDSELHKKRGDTVHVTDPNRIEIVTSNLDKLGLSQGNVDTVMRLLDLDRYKDESALLNGSYSSMREALVACTQFAFDNPLFNELEKQFAGLAVDRRDYGDKIRIARVRNSCRLMREITSIYGISNRGLFSSITGK